MYVCMYTLDATSDSPNLCAYLHTYNHTYIKQLYLETIDKAGGLHAFGHELGIHHD